MTTMTRERKPPVRFEAGFMSTLDKRTELCKRLQKAFSSVIDDLGGADGLPHTQLVLIEKFVWLEHTMRVLESKIAKNSKNAQELLPRYLAALNSSIGLAKTIGLKRKPKTIDVKSYVAGKDRDK